MIIIRHRTTSPRFHLTREQLRKIAKDNNVRRGRNTAETVANLRNAGIKF